MKLVAALVAATLVLPFTPVLAQTDYPTQAVTLVVPFAAGGPTDLAARALADGLSKMWKQTVVVENKPGGGTIIGIASLLNAKPDGYTLGVFTNSFVVNPGVRSNVPYDTLKDFKGISMMAESPTTLAAIASFPANNLPELIEEAKKHADAPLTFASPGLATGGHLSMELLQRQTGTKFQHLPYNGSTQALPDVLSGRVPLISSTWTDVQPYVLAGQLKLLAVMGATRLTQQPDVATVGETIPGFSATGFNGVLAAAGVPDEIIEKVSGDMKQVISSPEFVKKVTDMGSIPWSTTPAETSGIINDEVAKWKQIAEEQKIKLD